MEAKLRITLTPGKTSYTQEYEDREVNVTLLDVTRDSSNPGAVVAGFSTWNFTGDYYDYSSTTRYPTFYYRGELNHTLNMPGDSVTSGADDYIDFVQLMFFGQKQTSTLAFLSPNFVDFPSNSPSNSPYYYRVTYNYNGLHTVILEDAGGGKPSTLEITVNDSPGGVGTLNVSGDAGIAEVYYNGNTYYPKETTVSIPLVADATALGIQSASPTATINANETVQKVQVGSKVYTSFPATVKGSPGETMGITVTAAPYPEITVKYEGTQTPVVTNT